MPSQRPTAKPSVSLSLVKEKARVEKRWVQTGKVRVRILGENVREFAAAVLDHHNVDITRVALNRPLKKVPSVRTVGGVTIVPVVEEIMVIEKRLILTEELHIRRRTTTEHVRLPVSLKKQRAVIERVRGGGSPT